MNAPNDNICIEQAPDGTDLRIGHWQGNPGADRIVICHGRTEFLEKYDEVIGELNARGFNVWSMDWRGQGLSGRALANPQKGHIDDFRTYIDDLAWFMNRFVPNSSGTTIMMAHSMGGHIVLRAALEGRIAPDGIVLSAPMIDLPMRRSSRAAIAVLCRVLTACGLGGKYVFGLGDYDPARVRFDGNPLTSDRKRFATIHSAMVATPGVEMGGPTFGWLDAAFKSIARLRRLAASPGTHCPVLMCTADADRVVSVDAQNVIASALSSCRQLKIPGCAHEILHETDAIRDRFWQAFDEFTGNSDS